jgi:hypothetical protein
VRQHPTQAGYNVALLTLQQALRFFERKTERPRKISLGKGLRNIRGHTRLFMSVAFKYNAQIPLVLWAGQTFTQALLRSLA